MSKIINVNSQRRAREAYWSAANVREEQAAYHELLLFGGHDGFREGWRPAVARCLRQLALKIEGEGPAW